MVIPDLHCLQYGDSAITAMPAQPTWEDTITKVTIPLYRVTIALYKSPYSRHHISSPYQTASRKDFHHHEFTINEAYITTRTPYHSLFTIRTPYQASPFTIKTP
ncbi:hypothetical protein E2C01_102715 [Portunus trituberculatus]|uniref:Uncharacterized protein n=1 Tax=Portunus trituberculatus TaxID=210409 RepID=A0A5B7KJ11_PORTR|nr:hypothetical protein [Portunus trituberculatus]